MGLDYLFDYDGDVGRPPEGTVDNFLFNGQEKWDCAETLWDESMNGIKVLIILSFENDLSIGH